MKTQTFSIVRNIVITSSNIGNFWMPKFSIFFIIKILEIVFRHVILPSSLAKLIPKTHLMTETEWRNLGIQQSPGE